MVCLCLLLFTLFCQEYAVGVICVKGGIMLQNNLSLRIGAVIVVVVGSIRGPLPWHYCRRFCPVLQIIIHSIAITAVENALKGNDLVPGQIQRPEGRTSPRNIRQDIIVNLAIQQLQMRDLMRLGFTYPE